MKDSLMILIVTCAVLSSTPAQSGAMGPSLQPEWEPEAQVKLGWIFDNPYSPQNTDPLDDWDRWIGDQPIWDYNENRVDPWGGNPAQWFIQIPNLDNDNPANHFWLSYVYERDNTYQGDRVFTNVSWSPFNTYETIHVSEELFDINGISTNNVFLAAYGRITAVYDMAPNPQYEKLYLGVTGTPANQFTLLEVYVMTQCVPPSAPLITVNVSSNAGGVLVTPKEGDAKVEKGEVLTLRAQARPNHFFAGWSGSCVDLGYIANPNEPNTVLTAEADCVIKANFLSKLDIIYVDDNAENDPGPNDISISDPNEDGSNEHPFDEIQEAIEVARQHVKVLVREGTYYETLDMMGRNIDVNSFDPNLADQILAFPVIDANNMGTALTFDQAEDPNCRISGFVITGGFGQPGAIACLEASPQFSHCIIAGNRCADPNGDLNPYDPNNAVIYCQDSNSIFENCTIHGNYGGPDGATLLFSNCNATITNTILWDNIPYGIITPDGNDPNVSYCDILDEWPGLGNIHEDPCFAEPGLWVDVNKPELRVEPNDPNAVWMTGDYHLMSRFGRYVPYMGDWLTDLTNSPCLDAGNPNAVWQPEPIVPWAPPGTERLNMGAYGGTNQASKMVTDKQK